MNQPQPQNMTSTMVLVLPDETIREATSLHLPRSGDEVMIDEKRYLVSKVSHRVETAGEEFFPTEVEVNPVDYVFTYVHLIDPEDLDQKIGGTDAAG